MGTQSKGKGCPRQGMGKARLTAKEKAKKGAAGARDSVKSIKKSLCEKHKTKVRRSKGLHADQRKANGLAVKRKSFKKTVGTLPNERRALEAQDAMSRAESCLEDSVLLLLEPDNQSRKQAEAA